jgi:hypothetical protein
MPSIFIGKSGDSVHDLAEKIYPYIPACYIPAYIPAWLIYIIEIKKDKNILQVRIFLKANFWPQKQSLRKKCKTDFLQNLRAQKLRIDF